MRHWYTGHVPKGVYSITSPSGKLYIGMSTVSVEQRWRQHRNELRRNAHKCTGLQNAANRYGIDNLTFELLEDLDGASSADILVREQQWWDKVVSTGALTYNGRPSGAGSVFHSGAVRQKISESLKANNPRRICRCANVACGGQMESPRPKQIYCSVRCRTTAVDSVSLQRLVELRESNLSLRAIAARVGISHVAVRKRLQEVV